MGESCDERGFEVIHLADWTTSFSDVVFCPSSRKGCLGSCTGHGGDGASARPSVSGSHQEVSGTPWPELNGQPSSSSSSGGQDKSYKSFFCSAFSKLTISEDTSLYSFLLN